MIPRIMTEEKMNLSWNKFNEITVTAFKHLGRSKDFADVTLACEDGETVQAHRAILSSCSPVLAKILLQIPLHQNHPFLYMKGMNRKDLNQMLDFIYFGEVLVEKENLEDFLEIANELKIAGLTKTNSSEVGEDREEEEDNNTKPMLEEPSKTSDLNLPLKLESETEIVEEIDHERFCSDCQKEFSTKANLKTHILTLHGNADVSCNECDYKTGAESNLKRHMQRMHTSKTRERENETVNLEDSFDKKERKANERDHCGIENKSGKALMKHRLEEHPGQKFFCIECGKEFASNNSLKIHKMSIHDLIKYSCDVCSKQFNHPSNLSSHKRNNHTAA